VKVAISLKKEIKRKGILTGNRTKKGKGGGTPPDRVEVENEKGVQRGLFQKLRRGNGGPNFSGVKEKRKKWEKKNRGQLASGLRKKTRIIPGMK